MDIEQIKIKLEKAIRAMKGNQTKKIYFLKLEGWGGRVCIGTRESLISCEIDKRTCQFDLWDGFGWRKA